MQNHKTTVEAESSYAIVYFFIYAVRTLEDQDIGTA